MILEWPDDDPIADAVAEAVARHKRKDREAYRAQLNAWVSHANQWANEMRKIRDAKAFADRILAEVTNEFNAKNASIPF